MAVTFSFLFTCTLCIIFNSWLTRWVCLVAATKFECRT